MTNTTTVNGVTVSAGTVLLINSKRYEVFGVVCGGEMVGLFGARGGERTLVRSRVSGEWHLCGGTRKSALMVEIETISATT